MKNCTSRQCSNKDKTSYTSKRKVAMLKLYASFWIFIGKIPELNKKRGTFPFWGELSPPSTSSSQNGECLLTSTVQPSASIWAQEVMSVCMPVRDKSNIPTEPFPKINKQNLPTCVYVDILICAAPSISDCASSDVAESVAH